MLPTFFDNLSLLSLLNLLFLSGDVYSVKGWEWGWIAAKWRNVCARSTGSSNISLLFQLWQMAPSPRTFMVDTEHSQKFSFWNMLHGPLRWAPEDSPFIWQESNLVVWAHLEFVSTDNLDISWPTNNHKRSLYIYWEWTSSHALSGFLLGERNSRTTYPSVTELFHLFRLNETWRSFFSFNLFITCSSGIFRIRGFFSGKQFTP